MLGPRRAQKGGKKGAKRVLMLRSLLGVNLASTWGGFRVDFGCILGSILGVTFCMSLKLLVLLAACLACLLCLVCLALPCFAGNKNTQIHHKVHPSTHKLFSFVSIQRAWWRARAARPNTTSHGEIMFNLALPCFVLPRLACFDGR